MHWNKSDTADFQRLTREDGTPRGSSASWHTVGALMCWAYTHQNPRVLRKFSLYSCSVTLLFFLGFLSGFICSTLSQNFSFFDCFKARVLCLLMHTPAFTEILKAAAPVSVWKREEIHNVQQQKRRQHLSSSVFSPSVDFSGLCQF